MSVPTDDVAARGGLRAGWWRGARAPLPTLRFTRRMRLDRQRMHPPREFHRQRRVNHAMAFDPALPFEGFRHNIEPEMRFAVRPVAGMAFMKMRFIDDIDAFRRESFAQLVCDSVLHGHGGGNTHPAAVRQRESFANVKT